MEFLERAQALLIEADRRANEALFDQENIEEFLRWEGAQDILKQLLEAAPVSASSPALVAEAEEPSINIGQFTITSYCPCAKRCGERRIQP